MPDREDSILLAYEVTAGESPQPSKAELEKKIEDLQRNLNETLFIYNKLYNTDADDT